MRYILNFGLPQLTFEDGKHHFVTEIPYRYVVSVTKRHVGSQMVPMCGLLTSRAAADAVRLLRDVKLGRHSHCRGVERVAHPQLPLATAKPSPTSGC